jgi:thymidylate kinase
MLIVFEGLDGVGKSTVVQGVVNHLNAKLMRTPSPFLKEARRQCSALSPNAEEALFDLGNVMASEEMRQDESHAMVCDRYVISTEARRFATQHGDSPSLFGALSSWTWPEHLFESTLCVHLCLQEDERKKRVRHRGEMTPDEERLEVDPRYRAALLMAYSELCDITLDLTGLDKRQAVAWVIACLEERLPGLKGECLPVFSNGLVNQSQNHVHTNPSTRDEIDSYWGYGE